MVVILNLFQEPGLARFFFLFRAPDLRQDDDRHFSVLYTKNYISSFLTRYSAI